VAAETQEKSQQPQILGKPVFFVDTRPLNECSGFRHKRLCDGFTFTAGTACAYSCKYCYVETHVLKQKKVREILEQSGLPFNEISIRRTEPLRNLARQLTRVARGREDVEPLLPDGLQAKWGLHGEWSLDGRLPKYRNVESEGKVIYGSPLVDVAATRELADETTEICEMLLHSTNFNVRLLSKSPLLKDVAEELHRRLPDPDTGAKKRLILGFSTGTLDDGVARAIEAHTPSPTVRIRALHQLQDQGFRTYGMVCPVLPQANEDAYRQFAATAMRAIRADQCEEIWAEPLNLRAGKGGENPEEHEDSFTATLSALQTGNFNAEAELFRCVSTDRTQWEQYARSLFMALKDAAPRQNLAHLVVGEKAKAEQPNKLWFLHYPQSYASIRTFWSEQQPHGALLLGAVATRYNEQLADAAGQNAEIAVNA
jgi:DNA repair photolyase